MRRRALGVLLAVLLVLALGSLGCSVGQLLARSPTVTVVPTRTPRPTWTSLRNSALAVATPTLDVTRFPGVSLPTAPPPSPQVLVPGSGQPLFIPQPAEGAPGVQTVVVIIVTATPPLMPTHRGPEASTTPLPLTNTSQPTTPEPTATPGPPTATPTITNTPLPPVVVRVAVDQANVRQGPGTAYVIVTQLDAGTEVTVVGRNRAGDWWKICCVNGIDVWIADSVVTVEGPIWSVPEVTDIPPAPPTQRPPPTGAPMATPTSSWTFRVEGRPEQYPLGQNYFRVNAVIYNGATPLWGYKLRIRKLSTGQDWLTVGSESYWKSETIQYGSPDKKTPQVGLKYNVKWDSNGVGVLLGDDTWEVTVTDGAGNALSEPVRFVTSVADSKWFYIVFTSRK